MESSNHNNIVLITGSSSGIGQETAYQFAKNNSTLIITHHQNESDGQRVAEKCRQLNARDVLLINLDLTNDDNINKNIDHIIDQYGRIDILINNAGVSNYQPLVEQTSADIDNQIKTNLEGLIKTTQKCLPHIKKSIINLGSNIIFYPKKNMTVYSATKAGVSMFTKCLAKEYPNLKIFTVNPTLTATKMGGAEGMKAEQVAEIIYKLASNKLNAQSGADINMSNYRYGEKWAKPFSILKKVKRLITKH